jgi:2-aminoethylphosphonate--pyruvate transaminase/phosphonoacetaldehyde hydrolase
MSDPLTRVLAVVFDWAGTTVDYGCMAPVEAFTRAFASQGIDISEADVRAPMGRPKREHLTLLLALPDVAAQWATRHGGAATPADVDELYRTVERLMDEIAPRRVDLLPGVLSVVEELRAAGLAIGSCTGYPRRLMATLEPLVAKLGYRPDATVTPDEVPEGRPAPYMCYSNALALQVFPMDAMVKVGDTVADVLEGRAAGMWTVATLLGGSELGLGESAVAELGDAELARRMAAARARLLDAGAHYVLDAIGELPGAVADIEQRLRGGERAIVASAPAAEERSSPSMSAPGRTPGGSGSFDPSLVPDEPYLLLTPGPLSTTKSVRAAMLRDWCTWDDDYKSLTQDVRARLTALAAGDRAADYSVVLVQGSGSFGVEAVLGTFVPARGRLLVLANGAHGRRMAETASRLGIDCVVHSDSETAVPEPAVLAALLDADPGISSVAFVHCETTSGILNPVAELADVIKRRRRTLIVDAMSSFGGIPLDVPALGIDVLVSSANKCIQGVPGFSFAVARRATLEQCEGNARSLCLDLSDQWQAMDRDGKWRFTSPTHAVHAFRQALLELEQEGGIEARHRRYVRNQSTLVGGLAELGIETLLPRELQSPIITSFPYPAAPDFSFGELYRRLKSRGYVIYPGKVTARDTFRIGTIGDVQPQDMEALVAVFQQERFWTD